MGRISCLGACLIIAGLTATASAQPATGTPPPTTEASADDAAARLLFNTAREAFAAGNYEVALQRFQQAYDLSHRSALLYNIGTTLDRLRRDREALASFERFLAEDTTSPNRSEVEARVRVLRAGIEEQDRLLAERQRQQEEQQRALEEAQRRADEQAARASTSENQTGLPPAVFFSVAGTTVLTAALGLGFGIQTNSRNDTYRELGDARRDPVVGETPPTAEQVQAAYDDAKSSQAIANAMLFTSAALAIGSVVLVFVTDWDGDPEPSAAASRVRVLPAVAVAPGQANVGLQISF